jgi:hypothetical protein
MEIRAKLKEHSKVVVAISLVVVAVAFVICHSTRRLTDGVVPPTPVVMAFYTTDDGRTFFSDVSDKPTPFDHDGRQAVKAYIYTTDGRTRWVQCLEKQDGTGGLLVKRPRDTQWVSSTDPAAAQIREPKPKNGVAPLLVSAIGG